MRISIQKLVFSAFVVSLGTLPLCAASVLKLVPAVGPPTTATKVSGTGFGANETVSISFDNQPQTAVQADAHGNFQANIAVPRVAQPGTHAVQAVGQNTGDKGQGIFTVRTDWPTFHFNNQRNGVNRFENVLKASNVPRLQLSWQGLMGELADFSSPAVVSGVVYIGSTDGNLYAFDANGCGNSECSALWTGFTGDAIYSSPAVADGVVYVGSNRSEE